MLVLRIAYCVCWYLHSIEEGRVMGISGNWVLWADWAGMAHCVVAIAQRGKSVDWPAVRCSTQLASQDRMFT
jgi:hypothetical protein